MSIEAMVKAGKTQTGSASEKLLLLVMSNLANEAFECYPSYKYLCYVTELNIKTVKTCIKNLIVKGILLDTGKRVGKTKKIVVYKLNFECTAMQKNNEMNPKLGPLNEPKIGPISNNEMSPKTGPLNEPKNGPISNRSKPATVLASEGKNEGGTLNIITRNNSNKKEKNIIKKEREIKKTDTLVDKYKSLNANETVTLLENLNVSKNLAQAFFEHRKRKKAPVNEKIINKINAEALNANLSLTDALELILERGWTSFKSEWVIKSTAYEHKTARQKESEDFFAQIFGKKEEKLIIDNDDFLKIKN